MIKKVLIATDLSDASFSLVDCLKELKLFGVQSVVLQHVIDLKYATTVPQKLIDESINLLAKQAEMLSEDGLTVYTDLKQGIPHIEILKAAWDNNVSAIIVGSHGKSVAREIVLGSVTSQLIEEADLPLLIIRMSLFDTTAKARSCAIKMTHLFKDVLFPTDFSDENKAAIEFLKGMKQYIEKLHVVHVQEPLMLEQPIEFDMQELDAINIKRLQDICNDFKPELKVTCEVLHGLPNLEILDYSKAHHFTLIVMGTRGLGAAARFFIGSNSRYIIRHSELPVFIIPSKKERHK